MSIKDRQFKIVGFRIGKNNLDNKISKTSIKPPKRVSLEIKSNKRSNAGFHTYPEYEKAVQGIAHYKNKSKGQGLEFLVDFYISHIPEDQLQEVMKHIEGANEANDDW